jgi:hypothetical protein
MNNRQLAQVGLGLLGVWVLLTAITEFIQIAAVVSASIVALTLAEILPVGLMLGLSYLLIFHNARVTTAIFPDVDSTTDADGLTLSRALVALTGIMLLVRATPSALNIILAYMTADGIDPTMRGRVLRPLLGAALPIGVGIYLLTRPQRLIDYLERPAPAASHDATDEMPIA